MNLLALQYHLVFHTRTHPLALPLSALRYLSAEETRLSVLRLNPFPSRTRAPQQHPQHSASLRTAQQRPGLQHTTVPARQSLWPALEKGESGQFCSCSEAHGDSQV